MSDAEQPELSLRETIDRHAAALADEISAHFKTRLAAEIQRERTGIAEQINQVIRRMRTTDADYVVLQLLAEESGAWAQRAVVLMVESNQARIVASRGAQLRDEVEDTEPIDLREAAAISSCVETNDSLVALGVPGEVSAILATALSRAGNDRVYLFPVLVRHTTVAVVLACGNVQSAPIEVLCGAAGLRLQTLEPPPLPEPVAVPLVQIAPTEAKAENGPSWSRLTPDDQALHLKAQRTAKVRVAQIRISESEALRNGIQTGDIYAALRASIDAAREEFRRTYIERSNTMVDYLHLEMTRSLAHDNPRLLGPDYPGPIA